MGYSFVPCPYGTGTECLSWLERHLVLSGAYGRLTKGAKREAQTDGKIVAGNRRRALSEPSSARPRDDSSEPLVGLRARIALPGFSWWRGAGPLRFGSKPSACGNTGRVCNRCTFVQVQGFRLHAQVKVPGSSYTLKLRPQAKVTR